MRTSLGSATVSILLLAAACALAGEDRADVVWVVDVSLNAGRDGGAGRARGFVSAMTGILAGNVARVAVVRCAGWTETSRLGCEVLPLTPVPEDLPGRIAFLRELEKTLQAGLAFEATASDLNAAFLLPGGVMDQVKKAREGSAERPVVVAVLSAGQIEAIETVVLEEKVRVVARPEYVDGAKARAGDANRESVNAEALRAFREGSLPGLAALGRVRVVAARNGGQSGDELLQDLAKPGAPLDLGKPEWAAIRTAFGDALSGAGAGRPAAAPFAQEAFEAGAGAEAGRDVAVVAGTAELGVAVIGAPPFALAWTGPEGSAPGDAASAVFGSEGGIQFCLAASPPPGVGRLAVRPPAGAPGGRFEVLGFRTLKYAVSFEVAAPAGPLYSGETVPARISVSCGDPPSRVLDERVLAAMEAELSLSGPAGEGEKTRAGFAAAREARLELPVRVGDGTWAGKARLEVRVRAFPREAGGFEFESAPVSVELDAIRGTTEIEVEFADTQAFAHQEIRIEGRIEGREPSGPVEARLVREGAEGKEKAVALFGGEKPGLLWGKTRLAEAGTWKIVSRPAAKDVPALRPGKKATLAVAPRAVVLEDKDATGAFKPAAEARATWYGLLPEGAAQGGVTFVRADLAAGEKCRIRIGVAPSGPWKARVLAGDAEFPAEGVEVTSEAPRLEIRVVVEPTGDSPAKGEAAAGKLVPALLLAGAGEGGKDVDVSADVPLKVDVVPAPPPWFMNPILWAAAGAAVLLLVFVVWRFTGSRFEYQNLVLQGEAGLGKAPFFFVDNAYGMKRQKSVGTDEAQEAVRVKVGRGGECFIASAASDVEIRVNGVKISGNFNVKDGNLVEVRKGEANLTYRYHSKPSVPEDLKDDEFVLMEYDEDDDFVIAEDDGVPEPEAEPAPAGPAPEAAAHGWVDEAPPAPEAGEPPAGGAAPAEPGLKSVSESEFEGLVSQKPPADLVTAAPLPMDGAVPEAAPAEGSFDDGQTLMGVTAPAREAPAEPAPEAPGTGGEEAPEPMLTLDEDATFVGAAEPEEVPPAEEAPAEEAPAEGPAAGEPPAEEKPGQEKSGDAFDDAATLMGLVRPKEGWDKAAPPKTGTKTGLNKDLDDFFGKMEKKEGEGEGDEGKR